MLFRPMESLYTRLSRDLFFHILVVAVVPALFMGIGVYYQFKVIVEQEQKQRLNWQMRHTQIAADRFLEEHMAALSLLFCSHSVEEFNDPKRLQHIFTKLKQEYPNFIDLGLVDSTGRQNTYDGPYKLLGRNYLGEEWFQDVMVLGTFISDVFFMKHHQIPHLLMAVKSPSTGKGGFWVIRATINSEVLDHIAGAMNWGDEDDTFILNNRSILQNTSRFHGSVLNSYYMPMHETAQHVVWTEEIEVLTHEEKPRTNKAAVIYTSLQNKNWTLTHIQPYSEMQ
ncbi:MAG: cache domain-containing protein, partial [Deltaproteobacteria bacterium]|nr:cache domain-containing protein [Deltaproteobacteria bacterium]